MHDYKTEHYRFTRQSGLRRSDFEEPAGKLADWFVLVAAIIILIAVMVME